MAATHSWFKRHFYWMLPSKKQSSPSNSQQDNNMPAQYWPEVQLFLDEFRALVIEKTVDDKHKIRMNEQVLKYLEKQIENKTHSGSVADKVHELEIIADRLLSTTMNKFVGLKPQTDQQTEFSDLINKFKSDLEKRKNPPS